VTTPGAAADLVVGLALIALGTLIGARHARTTGSLLLLAGATWLAGDLSQALAYAHRGPLVHALLTYPSGRTRSPLIAAVIVAAYVDGLVPELARSPWPTIALTAAVVGAAAWRYMRAPGRERRMAAVPLVGAVVIGAALVLAAVGNLTDASTAGLAAWIYNGAIVLTAGAMAVMLFVPHSTQSAAAGLVIDLGDRHEIEALRAALARALGDPRLRIAYRVGEHWVDETGRPTVLPAESSEAGVVTVVEHDGVAVAALVHDPAALRDETLARSVAAAVRLVVANVRLQADVHEQLREVADSRRRLVEAGDDEHRRLREQLADGAERRLQNVSADFTTLASGQRYETAEALGRLGVELDAARADLARFAHGVHPQALTQEGLTAALGELVATAAVPVELFVSPDRLPASHEATAFFVCSEGLANVAKYAGARRARIEVKATDSRLVVRVSDDGVGGADASRGTGLRGLADRVEALGGSLSVSSPFAAGTRLEAELPLAAGSL